MKAHNGASTHDPGLLAGTGTRPLPTLSTSSGVILSYVISDSQTPGAIEETRTGTFLSANSVASILERCVAAAFALLYANCDANSVRISSSELKKAETYVVLRKLDAAAHARNVDYGRGVSRNILAALGEKAEESGCHEEDREGVDTV